jgi:hypothetical protein
VKLSCDGLELRSLASLARGSWRWGESLAFTLDDVLPVAITVAVQRLSDMRVGPDTAHLFIDVLTEVGYIEDRTPIIEARIIEVFSQTFERGERNFPFVDVHK